MKELFAQICDKLAREADAAYPSDAARSVACEDCAQAIRAHEFKPNPMATASRDGTVVLVFAEGADYPHPMCWKAPWPNEPHCETDTMTTCWRMAWDDTQVADNDLLGWLPVPTYSGKAVV